MNKFLLALVLVTSSAHATGVVFTMNNNSGGKIQLTNISCRPEIDKPGNIARAYGIGEDNYGCWIYDSSGDTVSIFWTQSGWKTYNSDDFSITAYGRTQVPK